jgi:hypothetical protein
MTPDFATRIREKYDPQGGLTGVFAIGGTRTTYILDQNRDAAEPGRITDFEAHAQFLKLRYWEVIKMYFDLGGQNMILTAFSFRSLEERGPEYAALVAPQILKMIAPDFQAFYTENGIDPYFVGIDSLALSCCHPAAQAVQQQLVEFLQKWPYQPGHFKLVWEIASIPLYSFWKFCRDLSASDHAALEAEMAAQTSMEDIARLLHRRFSRAVYGTELPMPHFYLGTNRNGDLKWRSPMPLALSGGEYLRMFYTPYPSLFITRETMQAFLADLAFGSRLQAFKKDYAGQYTPALAQAEYKRVMALASRPETTLGLSRQVAANDGSAE